MTGFPFVAAGFLMNVVAVLFVLTSVLLILVILIQKGKGGGLSGAFGGGMAGNLLGSKTGDFLTWVTVSIVGVFLLLAIVMAKWYRPDVEYAPTEQTQQNQPVAPIDSTADLSGPGAPAETSTEPAGSTTPSADANAGG